MQTRIDDVTQRTAEAVAAEETRDGGAEDIAYEQATRPHEELRMLYIGFFTGITVGLIFIIYIIAAAVHALP